MEISYNFHGKKNINLNRKKITEKFKKLIHFDDKINALTFDIKQTNSHSPSDQYTVATKIKLKNKLIYVHETGETLLNILDSIYHKLQHQIKKYRSKITSHRPIKPRQTSTQRKTTKTTPKTSFSSTFNDKYCIDKPVTIDDAIKEMENHTYPFMVFRNMNQHEKLSVIYKNGQKKYNIIET
jgi:ribosomal subunit interface protein